VGYAALYDYRFPNGADQFDQNWLPFLSHLLAFLNYTFQEKIIETNVPGNLCRFNGIIAVLGDV